MKARPGERTLLASVALSAPGPLVVGIGLLLGRSSTQLADFVRRTAELAAIVVSWAVFRRTGSEKADPSHKARLERMAHLCVGAAMALGGAVMLLLAFWPGSGEKGNVIPGLVIAALGVVTNTWFWLRYRRLSQADPNGVLAAQSNLYRAKALVDACVTAALATLAAAPASALARYLDVGGAVAVAAYLLANGAALVARQIQSAKELKEA